MNEIIPFGETWVPEPARRKISEWRVRPGLTADEHRLIERLAGHPAMRTDVWQKLPPTARGAEGVIIEWSFIAARMAAGYRAPPANPSKDLGDGGTATPPHLTAETAAACALLLLQTMRTTNVEARLWWPSLWPGDPWLTFDKATAVVQQLNAFYQALDETGRVLAKALSLPPARKGSERAAERFFCRLLATLFASQFGQPLTPIIATLSTVIFDSNDSAGSSAVRTRQPSAARPPSSGARPTSSRKKQKTSK